MFMHASINFELSWTDTSVHICTLSYHGFIWNKTQMKHMSALSLRVITATFNDNFKLLHP
jgi:hypothetical protein